MSLDQPPSLSADPLSEGPEDPPLLRSLTPARVAAGAAAMFSDHLYRLGLDTSPSLQRSIEEVRAGFARLVEFAQRGGSGLHANRVLAQMTGSVFAPRLTSDEQRAVLGREAPHNVGLALRAALARQALEAGEPVTSGQLAVLAGISDSLVRKRLRVPAGAGDRRGLGPALPALEAHRWLVAHVVGRSAAQALREAHARTRFECGGGRRWVWVEEREELESVAEEWGWEMRDDGWWIMDVRLGTSLSEDT